MCWEEEEEVRKIDECDGEKCSEKTIAVLVLADRWWPHKANQEGGQVGKRFSYVIYGKTRIERLYVGGFSVRSRDGAPPEKDCVMQWSSD